MPSLDDFTERALADLLDYFIILVDVSPNFVGLRLSQVLIVAIESRFSNWMHVTQFALS